MACGRTTFTNPPRRLPSLPINHCFCQLIDSRAPTPPPPTHTRRVSNYFHHSSFYCPLLCSTLLAHLLPPPPPSSSHIAFSPQPTVTRVSNFAFFHPVSFLLNALRARCYSLFPRVAGFCLRKIVPTVLFVESEVIGKTYSCDHHALATSLLMAFPLISFSCFFRWLSRCVSSYLSCVVN